MTRTYGTFQFVPKSSVRPRPMWRLQLEPALAIRAKRVFGRAQQTRTGVIEISHTLDVARDLEWLMSRWPLVPADELSEQVITTSSIEHQEQERRVAEILTTPPARLDMEHLLAKTPRAYQLTALELLRTKKRYLLTDEVGLGKTLTGALNFVHADARPALVVPPAHLPGRWLDELTESLPSLSVLVAKKTMPPQEILDGNLPDVLIVPYSKLSGWRDALAGRVRSVVFDEVQELRRGTDSAKGSAAAHVAEDATYVLGLTATPVYNYGGEVWQLMNIIAPGELGTSTEFTREWGSAMNNGHIHVSNPAALGSYLREQGLMMGRTREDVGRELPPASKTPVMVNSDPTALAAVAGDAAEMARLILSGSSSREERWRAGGELDWKLREATGIAKAPFVAEFVRLLLQSEQRVVLFGWHRAVYDLWSELLAEFNPVMYTGSESPSQKRAAEVAFKTPMTDENEATAARILIMSLRSGSGIDGLQKSSSVAVFGELDWSPGPHDQGIGRLRRDGMDEDSPVIAYYLHSADGSDPALMETLQIKRNQAEPIVSRDGKLLTTSVPDESRARRLAQQVLGLVDTEPTLDIWTPTEQETALAAAKEES